MSKKIEILILGTIFIFLFFCAITIGHSWDLEMEINKGNERLKYIFFLSSFDNYVSSSRMIGDEFYPGFYTTLVSFVTKIFPKKYEFEIWQLTNSLFSILTVFGIYRISRTLFNKEVAKIIFILCILNPIFFGHMAMNPKDVPVAFANVWSTYVFLRYIQNQNHKEKCKKYILLAGLAIGFGIGIRIPFIITLLPVLLFVLIDIFLLKKIINSDFSFRKFITHFFIVLIIAYLVTISCWPQAHQNIFTAPFKIAFSINEFPLFGLPWIMLNGDVFKVTEVPNFYIFINFFYKTPEYILICYVIFIYLLISKINFFLSNFNSFLLKIFLSLFIISFPTILLIIFPYKIYDGLRLFLYLIPYFCIIPSLTIYYLIRNLKFLRYKILLATLVILFVYNIFIFLKLTPYQYTYLNAFSGNFSNAHTKFENDYWAVSIKELVKKIPLETNFIKEKKKITLAYCGVPHSLVKKELKKIPQLQYDVLELTNPKIDYILMTNRLQKVSEENVNTCFNNFVGEDLITVERHGLVLSALRKIKN